MWTETHSGCLRKQAGFTIRTCVEWKHTQETHGDRWLRAFPPVSVSLSVWLSSSLSLSLHLYRHLQCASLPLRTSIQVSYLTTNQFPTLLVFPSPSQAACAALVLLCFWLNSTFSASPSAPRQCLQSSIPLISKSWGRKVAFGLCHVSFTFHSHIICHWPTSGLNFT